MSTGRTGDLEINMANSKKFEILINMFGVDTDIRKNLKNFNVPLIRAYKVQGVQ